MTVEKSINQGNLGNKVTTRSVSWLSLVQEAWGPDFYAPDPNIYCWSNGRGFDSSDKGRTGLYGVDAYDYLMLADAYPDMRTALQTDDDNDLVIE